MKFTGIIIEESLFSKDILQEISIIQTKIETVTPEHQTPWIKYWTLHTVEISEENIDQIAEKIKNSLDTEHNWYADFKNKTTHYIVFRNRIFKINRMSKAEYEEATQYGISLWIPGYQVDFSPHVQEWKR